MQPGSRMIGNSGQHVGEPSLRVDAVELGGRDQGVDCRGALAAAVGTGEQPRSASQGNHAVILPMSGKRSRFTTAGTLCTDAVFDVSTSSGAPAVKSFTSRWHPVSFTGGRHGLLIPPPGPEWNWGAPRVAVS